MIAAACFVAGVVVGVAGFAAFIVWVLGDTGGARLPW